MCCYLNHSNVVAAQDRVASGTENSHSSYILYTPQPKTRKYINRNGSPGCTSVFVMLKKQLFAAPSSPRLFLDTTETIEKLLLGALRRTAQNTQEYFKRTPLRSSGHRSRSSGTQKTTRTAAPSAKCGGGEKTLRVLATSQKVEKLD